MTTTPVTIMDVVYLLGLEVSPRQRSGTSIQVKCPFCDSPSSNKYHMNINIQKNAYFCLHCMDTSWRNTGTLDLYGRVKYGTPLRPGENGKELFRLLMDDLNRGQPSTYRRKTVPEAPKVIEPKPDHDINNVYSAMIQIPELNLSDSHRQNLINRGMSEDGITRGGYITFPKAEILLKNVDPANKLSKWYLKHKIDNLKSQNELMRGMSKEDICAGFVVAEKLRRQGINLEHIPGFFRLGENHWCFRYMEGMLIPTKNQNGEIVGGQIRLDNKTKKGLRYLTVSSKGFPDGPDSKIARTHFVSAQREITKATTVMITEGPLKANVIIDLTLQSDPNADLAVIAIPGVNSVMELPKYLQWLTKECGVTEFLNVLDMDRYCNYHVYTASENIKEIFRNNGADIKDLTWGYEYAVKEASRLRLVCAKHDFPISISGNAYADIHIMTANIRNHYTKEQIALSDELASDWEAETKGFDDYLLHTRS